MHNAISISGNSDSTNLISRALQFPVNLCDDGLEAFATNVSSGFKKIISLRYFDTFENLQFPYSFNPLSQNSPVSSQESR